MKTFLNALLIAAGAYALPVAASAANYVDYFTISPDTEELAEQRRLRVGDTWTTNYDLSADMAPFRLDLVFSGNASGRGILSYVRYGIDGASTGYQTIVDSGTGTGRVGEGTIDGTYIDQPFSVVYTYLQSDLPNRTALVNFTGTIQAVPEIGAEGALPAVLLVMGSVAVMAGIRRRGGQALG